MFYIYGLIKDSNNNVFIDRSVLYSLIHNDVIESEIKEKDLNDEQKITVIKQGQVIDYIACQIIYKNIRSKQTTPILYFYIKDNNRFYKLFSYEDLQYDIIKALFNNNKIDFVDYIVDVIFNNANNKLFTNIDLIDDFYIYAPNFNFSKNIIQYYLAIDIITDEYGSIIYYVDPKKEVINNYAYLELNNLDDYTDLNNLINYDIILIESEGLLLIKSNLDRIYNLLYILYTKYVMAKI